MTRGEVNGAAVTDEFLTTEKAIEAMHYVQPFGC
jgi:hypothetical protein